MPLKMGWGFFDWSNNMRKLLLCSFAVLFLTCCEMQSQNVGMFIVHQTDSLDKVQPLDTPKVRASGISYVIKIRNQEQFEQMNAMIADAIHAGRKNIVVKIGRGTYQFHENHISLGKLDKREVSITVKGRNTVITSDENYSDDSYDLSPWGELRTADGLIVVVNEKQKLCKIPFRNNMTAEEVTACKQVQITQWYRAPVYQIEKMDNSGIYFYASELEYLERFGRKGYNVNYDYLYAGKTPRFRLYDTRKERPCKASCFLKFSNITVNSFTLQGINFRGSKVGAPLITMSSVDAAKVEIRNCTFDGIRDRVASFSGTGNVVFDRNKVTHTYGNELSFNGGCKNVRVTSCEFKDCGTGLDNTMCVRCNGAEYYIAKNSFCNFGYCAIGVGLWHGHDKKHDIRGIIEHNEIYFTPAYFVHRDQYTLMDAGAIYIWTQNDDAIIRYNYIHDYGGMRYNSGIYCDDGASNCKIYGNVILNTPDGCSISSRRVKDQKSSFKNNANNFMAGNVVDGEVVFAGYGTEERHCVKGPNYVVKGSHDTLPENKIENLETNVEDVVVQSVQEVKKLKELMWFK